MKRGITNVWCVGRKLQSGCEVKRLLRILQKCQTIPSSAIPHFLRKLSGRHTNILLFYAVTLSIISHTITYVLIVILGSLEMACVLIVILVDLEVEKHV